MLRPSYYSMNDGRGISVDLYNFGLVNACMLQNGSNDAKFIGVAPANLPSGSHLSSPVDLEVELMTDCRRDGQIESCEHPVGWCMLDLIHEQKKLRSMVSTVVRWSRLCTSFS